MISFGLNALQPYIGLWGVTIIALLIFFIIVRVAFALVMKIIKGVHSFQK